MIKIFFAAAMLSAQAAPPTAPKCLSKQSVGDAAMVMAPYLIEAVAKSCVKHVAANAFLNTGASAFAQRLRTESADRQASAVEVMNFITGGKLPKVNDQGAMLKASGDMAAVLIADKLDAKTCAEMNMMIQSLAPLPTRNVGMFASSLAGIIAIQSKGQGPGLCPE